MSEGKLNIKFTPEFDVLVSGPSMVKWAEKAEVLCKMCGVKHLEHMIPLRLSGGVFAVYQHLGKEERVDIN